MKLKDGQVDLCGIVGFQRDSSMPDLDKEDFFSFSCRGCGDCCRGREDIVLSGYDLFRIAKHLRLPPKVVSDAFCRSYIGKESHLPVLRLSPKKDKKRNCPFLFQSKCSIHDAKPLACALYPLAQEIQTEGKISYFLQPVECGGKIIHAKVKDYLNQYKIQEREAADLLWAKTCMELEQSAEKWGSEFKPAVLRRVYQKLTQALYFMYSTEEEFLPQYQNNLEWFKKEYQKLVLFQDRLSIKKSNG